MILKNISIILTAAFGLLVLFYLFLYLGLPFIINQNDYSKLITETVKKETGLELDIYKYKLKMSPTLALSLKAENVQLFYPDKQQILDVENAKINISTLHLLKKEIRITKVKAEKVQFSSKLKKSGKLSIQEYLEKNHKTESDFKYSSQLPVVKVDDYLIKIKDEKSGLHFKITGKDYRLTQDIIRKNMLVTTSGEIYSRGNKNIDYKLKLSIPRDIFTSVEKSKLNLGDLAKYAFKARVDADMKIFSKDGKYDYSSGKVKITDFSILLNGIYTPPSYADVTLDKYLANLDAKIFTAKSESADIKAKIKLTKPENIELHCKTSQINIANLKTMLVPILDLMKVKNNLSEFRAQGFISADFDLKTDLKKVKSNGKLVIKNAGLKHKEIPLDMNGINAEIDFSNDTVKITHSNLYVNGQPVNITGTIDKNASGDIKVSANNLDINHIMNAFPELKPQKTLTVTSGKLSFDAFIKGKLSKIEPKIKSRIQNFSAEIAEIKLSTELISLNTEVKNNLYSGNAQIKNILVKKHGAPVSISSELVSADFNEKNINVNDSKIFAGKTPIMIEGSIKNYRKSPQAEFNAAGTIDTSLIMSFLDQNAKKMLAAKGALPTVINIKTKNNTAELSLNAIANNSNFIKPEAISLSDTGTTLTRLYTKYAKGEENTLLIKDFSLYSAPDVKKASLNTDTSSLSKIISITGVVANNQLRNTKISIPKKTQLKIKNSSSFKTDGELILNGNIEKPSVLGVINLYDINLPDYKISLNHAAANFNNDSFKTSLNGLKIKNMTINSQITAAPDFLQTRKISNLKISSNMIDMEELLTLSGLLPQTTYAPGPECPFDIQTGEIFIKTYKMNKVFATNVHSNISINNNVLNFHDLTADAYNGKIAAKITYNLPYATLEAKMQGRNLNAESAGRNMFPVDPKTTGVMSFDSDIKTFGFTENQHKKNLTGTTDILIKNAQLGPLGRFEHFLYAQNLLSQRLIYVSLNSAKQAITPQDTGRADLVKTSVRFKNGYMYLNPVQTSGPQMSMYVTGNINMMNNIADLQILGKISSEVSSSLGLFGQMTLKDFLDEHTKYGPAAAKLFSFYNKELPEMDISKIPSLTPALNRETKNFRVIIEGDIDSVKSVKSFTWVNPIGTSAKYKKQQSATQEEKPKTPQQQEPVQPQKPQKQEITKPQVQQQPRQQTNFLDNIPDTFSPTKPQISS